MKASSRERLELVVATARTNPEFARRLLDDLPEEARAFVLARLSRPKELATTSLGGPGLRKCRPTPAANNGLSAQLNLFAKAVSRVS